ncbi:MAG: DEAD/DEAH box helicase [Nitrospirota bacterium]
MAKVNIDFSIKTAPLPHQIEAIDYIKNHERVALFDEQGLGKTKIVIDALSQRMKNRYIDGVLVVAPMSLLYNWEMEVQKHSFLIPIVLRGGKREKRYKFLTGANFYITNYESVISELTRMKRFCKSQNIAIVLDESARIKDPTTKTAQALFELIPLSKQRIIITGTPVANKPYDLWGQFFFLDEGVLLGTDYNSFKADLSERKLDYRDKLQHLREILESNSIRRLKADELELPDKSFVNIYVELIGKQKELYEQLREELRIEILNTDGDVMVDEAQNILKKLLRLTQIASNPALVDRAYAETPAKLAALDGLIKDICAKGEKVILWTSFIDNIKLLNNRYIEYKPLIIFGETQIADRANIVQRFQELESNRILIANPAAAREGLTLTKANNAIYFDRNFNLVDYLQSQDRIHRISQTKNCTIYKLLARSTVDEYIDRLVGVKQDIAMYIQGDTDSIKTESYEFLLNKQELLGILG